jgi:hypothetical protein
MMDAMEQHRHERVLIETARHRIEGTLTLARDGYRSRVSDVLNATERDFVSLTDATLTPHDDPARVERHPFVIVSRHQIVLAIPLDLGAGPSGGSQPPPLTSV